MLKENTYYRAKKDFNLSIDHYNNDHVEALKDETLFILSVEYNKSYNLYAIGLIKDFKLYNTFWTKEAIESYTDEIF